MPARFIGRFEHSIDAKGRVILPSRFRREFAGGGCLSQHNEGCLALWTPSQFDEQLDAALAAAARGRSERNLMRVWASGAAEVDLDSQGRVVIPAYLRAFAGLEADVLIVGAVDRLELWDPYRWMKTVLPFEHHLGGGDHQTSGSPLGELLPGQSEE